MLAYFPQAYPDELLYSVLARFSRHVGIPDPTKASGLLFGRPRVIATYDLPGNLNTLCQQLPDELSADVIITEHSLFPYYTRFVPEKVKQEVKDAMREGTNEGIHIHLGLPGFRIKRFHRFRYCHICSKEMTQTYGEYYWRRDHQLPGVLVCPVHQCVLSQSSVELLQRNRYEFIAATPANCPDKKLTLVAATRKNQRLYEVACRSAELLNVNSESHSFDEWTGYYRQLMIRAGYARSATTMKQKALHDDFISFYRSVSSLLPDVIVPEPSSSNWLSAIVRRHRGAFHPLNHVLVQNFLEHCEPAPLPFGKGPWPCRNPLAKHRSKKPIRHLSTHRNEGHIIGVFSCSCGYVYTRYFDPTTNKIGPARFYKFGYMFKPALQKLIAEGVSLRGIGRALGLNRRTVVKLASDAGVCLPWHMKSSGSVNRSSKPEHTKATYSRRSLSNNSVAKAKKNKRRRIPIKNWPEIDLHWVDLLKTAYAEAISECPPIRITMTNLELRNGKLGWIRKRRRKLPETMKYLGLVTETIEDFQLRRIMWAIEELERDKQQIKAWRIMRKTGLSRNKLGLVKSVIEERSANLFYAA